MTTHIITSSEATMTPNWREQTRQAIVLCAIAAEECRRQGLWFNQLLWQLTIESLRTHLR